MKNHGGNIWLPGDGSLENSDYKDDGYAKGHLAGGHDHWDSNGRLKELIVNMRSSKDVRYERIYRKRWWKHELFYLSKRLKEFRLSL